MTTMSRISKKFALAPVLLLLFWPLLSSALGAAEVQGPVTPAQYYPPPGPRGSLELRLYSADGLPEPPGEMVISSPAADAEGYDPRVRYLYNEIPGATYQRERLASGQQAVVLFLGAAPSGPYSLRLIGTDYDRYYLGMTGYDRDGNRADISFNALIEPGQVIHYLIEYSNLSGASIRARRTRIVE
jgi:hypothetical protein